MIKKRILIIAPYPITSPQHGGQKRVKAIVEYYKTIFLEVKFVAIYHRAFYQDDGPDNILIGDPNLIKEIDSNPNYVEFISGKAIDKDIHVRSAFAKILSEYKPDIIQVEQVFLYLGLAPLLAELNIKPRLILSSQNIEYKMKQTIYEELGVPPEISGPIVSKTQQLEEQFSEKADLVIAVSEEDEASHRSMGAKRCIVIPNGINAPSPSEEAVNYWQKFSKDKKINTKAVFIGSGHPPNWLGFLEMLGDDTTFMPAKSKILIGGGVSEYFKSEYKTIKYKPFWSGVLPLGHLSEDRLSGLLRLADIILLPITSGGGSNLKTAEAILSGKKIVSTRYAFRGFEKYKKLPNIYLADKKTDFRKQLLSAIDEEHIKRTPAEELLARHVQWQYCLQPLEGQLKKVARKNYKAAAGVRARSVARHTRSRLVRIRKPKT